MSIKEATLYCTTLPCVICSKMLINSGIRKIVYQEGYPDELAREMLDKAGVELFQLGSGS